MQRPQRVETLFTAAWRVRWADGRIPMPEEMVGCQYYPNYPNANIILIVLRKMATATPKSRRQPPSSSHEMEGNWEEEEDPKDFVEAEKQVELAEREKREKKRVEVKKAKEEEEAWRRCPRPLPSPSKRARTDMMTEAVPIMDAARVRPSD